MNDLQAAELAGFFWADGNFMLDIMRRINRKDQIINSIRVRVRISQRADNIEVLYHIKNICGDIGHICKHGNRKVTSHNGKTYTNNTQYVWQTQDKEQVSKFLDILEQSSSFPAKKRNEIIIMRKAIDIMRNRGHSYNPDELKQLTSLRNELEKIRKYSG